jgi:hypothetical protein
VVSEGEFIADVGGSAVDFFVPPSADVRDGVEDLLGGCGTKISVVQLLSLMAIASLLASGGA